MCAMTHSDVWHDSFICAIWLFHMCDMTHSSCVWRDLFNVTHSTWLIQRDFIQRDFFNLLSAISGTMPERWKIEPAKNHKTLMGMSAKAVMTSDCCRMLPTKWYFCAPYACELASVCMWVCVWLCACVLVSLHVVRRDSFICVTWLIHMCDVIHVYLWLICVYKRVGMWYDCFIARRVCEREKENSCVSVCLWACVCQARRGSFILLLWGCVRQMQRDSSISVT